MRKVYWTKLAISDFRKNIEFLKLRWNEIVIFDFIEKTECVIEIICDNPESGRWDQDIHCNKILVTKHIYLFYEMVNNKIYLLCFWNNFQKPYWPL